ncbi:MAG: adenosine deaminase [Bacteroidota bacterium]
MKELAAQILAMPKFELHVHMEGATEAETFFRLAQRNNMPLPIPEQDLASWQKYFEFQNFPHFIEVYVSAVSLLRSAEDYAFLIEEFYRHQAAQNIVYTEAFLSATYLVDKFDQEEILEAIARGMEAGKRKYGGEIRFIPDIARQEPESQRDVLELVKKGYDQGLFLGLGLGGLEIGFPPEMFDEVYCEAREHGMKVVAHAGEGVGPESIWGALNSLQAERIGHGVRSIEDDKLLAHLAEKQIPIEVSPTSNYCLGIVKPEEHHPIRKMVDAGLNCNINSDDPAMFSTSLTGEYLLLAEQGFSWVELQQLNRNALESSFMTEGQKRSYRQLLSQHQNH